MRVMVLRDGETYTGLQGCKIVDVPEDSFDDDIDIEVRLAAAESPLYTFHGDEDRVPPKLTAEERALIVEGLNFTEENGAPGMVPAMRSHTMRHAALAESITRKLGL